MPLTLIATPGATNANSYATVDDADTLASYRVGGAAFVALTSDQKIQALVTATRAIDTLEAYPGFIGSRYLPTQALAWPRGAATLPIALVNADIELAMTYATALTTSPVPDVLNATTGNGNIKVDQVGPISTEYFEATEPVANTLERFPAVVQALLYGLVLRVIEGWGSALVTRGS